MGLCGVYIHTLTDSPAVTLRLYNVYHNGRDNSNNNDSAQWLISSSRTTAPCDQKKLKTEHELRQSADYDFALQTLCFGGNVTGLFSPRLRRPLLIIVAHRRIVSFSFTQTEISSHLIDWFSVFRNQKVYFTCYFCLKSERWLIRKIATLIIIYWCDQIRSPNGWECNVFLFCVRIYFVATRLLSPFKPRLTKSKSIITGRLVGIPCWPQSELCFLNSL